MQASLPMNRLKTLLLPTLIAGPAILIFVSAWLYQTDPALLNQILAGAESFARRALRYGAYGLLGAVIMTLLIFPNALPHVRLALRHFSRRMNFDRRSAAEILRRMEDFQSIPDLLTLAQLYIDSDQGNLAMPLLVEIVNREADNARAILLMAKVFKSLRHWDEASDLACRSIKLEPELAFGDGLMLATECNLAAGRLDTAEPLARTYLERYGESIHSLSMLAEALAGEEHVEERRQHLKRILDLPSATATRGRFTPEEALERLKARRLLVSERQS